VTGVQVEYTAALPDELTRNTYHLLHTRVAWHSS